MVASESGSGSLTREARERAERRTHERRDRLRPLGTAIAAVVVIGAINGHPPPGLSGKGAGVAAAVVVYLGGLAVVMYGRALDERIGVQTLLSVLIAASGVALAWLQPKDATELAASAAVWVAVSRLPLRLGLVTAVATTIALAVALAVDGSTFAAVGASTLLCGLLGLIAYFMLEAAKGQERTELLLAELQEARDGEARAAAIAERGKIAGELHDVLAHSLSGAAIQLQAARMLAERDQAAPQLTEAVARAHELVREGLTDAKDAVGALRGDRLPGVEQLGALVEGFRGDFGLDATLMVDGQPHALPSEVGLTLYRGAQEALTNAARHAAGAQTTVLLRYQPDATVLRVENGCRTAEGLTGAGGGRGLAGMRDRVERAGGSMRAGPNDDGGWLVELRVPA